MLGREYDYNYLIKEFGEAVIKDRYSFMEKRANAFLKECRLENKVFLNHNILNVVVLDYFADLARLKEFEGIKRTNKNKITAFMSYWWLRRRPLQLKTDDLKDEDLVYINEKFISTLITKDFMYNNSEKIMSNEQCDKCIEHLFYHLKYRIYTAQTLELMLMAADTGIEIGKMEKNK